MTTYNNGPGTVPCLPEFVVDQLVNDAGVSRLAHDDKDQSAQVNRLVHDTCEELLARLPDHPAWTKHKPRDESWQVWRDANPAAVAKLRSSLVLTPEAEASTRHLFEEEMRADGVTNFERTALGRYSNMVLEWTWLGWRGAVRTGATS
ncbi:hypothetical protein ACHAC9_22175 [Massilia sp. CMS3.1]|uniref:hypothetical protein n=1 Tax=Massilia sp. CMS3.1 TaxID=3373083 RepID=UPI003EE55727